MGIKLGPIDIGDTKNSILNFDPLTRDIGEALDKTGGDILEGFSKTAGDVVEGVEKSLEDVAEGVGKTVDDVGDLARNPVVRAIASVVYPPAAPYLNAYAAAYDGKITLEEAVNFATSVGTDTGLIDVDPEVVKALEVGAKVGDGASPVEALAGAYGAEFAKDIGLDTIVKDNVKTAFGEDAYQFLDERMDINQAAADYAAGDSTERILGNQFGDELVGYIGSDDPNVQALGYAGIEGIVSKAEGLSDEEALLNSAESYYDKGGRIPKLDVDAITDVTGLLDFGVDLGKIDFPTIDIPLPEVKINWEGVNFGDLDMGIGEALDFGVDLGKLDWEGINFGDLDINLGEALDFDIDLGKLDWKGVEFDSLDMGLGEAADLGVDISKLNVGGIPLPAIGLTAHLALQEDGVGIPEDEEDILSPNRSTDNPLLADNGLPLSKAVLGTKL